MIGPAERSYLKNVVTKAEALAAQAPEEAGAFGRACNRLASKAEQIHARGIFGTFEPYERTQLDHGMHNLETVSDQIHAFLERRNTVLTDLRTLKGLSSEPAELRSWIQDQCGKWEHRLGGILATVDSPDTLVHETSNVDKIAGFCALITEAVRSLRQAQDFMESVRRENMGSLPVELAHPAARLEQLPHVLIQRGCDSRWMEELEQIKSVLKQMLDRPQANPRDDPAYSACREELDEAQGWAEVLDDEAVQIVDGLRNRLREGERAYRRGGGGASSFREIHHEARAYAQQLREQALETRQQLLTQLQEDYQIFERACGADTLAENAIREAEPISDLTPWLHGQWYKTYEQARALVLEAVNGAHAAGYIDTHIQERCTEIEGRLTAIEGRITDEAIRSFLQSTSERCRTIREPNAHHPPLETLRFLRDALLQLSTTEGDCDRLHEKLEGERNQLAAELDVLDQLAKRLNTQLETSSIARDLQVKIPTHAARAEDVRKGLIHLATELEALGTGIDAAAKSQLDEIRARQADDRATLTLLDPDQQLAAIDEAPEGAGLDLLVTRVEEARRQSEKAEGLLNAQMEALKTRVSTALQRLVSIPAADLALNDRGHRDDLVFQLQETSIHDRGSRDRHILRQLDILIECEKFLEALSSKDTRAHTRYEELKRRLNGLREHGLRDHCGPLELRVTALIHGIPADSTRWSRFSGQIKTASRLLQQVESEARRRCAAQLQANLRELGKKADRSTDSEFKEEARRLINQLNGPDSHMALPPPRVRMQVQTLLEY